MIRILLVALLLTGCLDDKTYPVNCLNMKTLNFVHGTYHSHAGDPYIEVTDNNGMIRRINATNSDEWICAIAEKENAAPVSQA